MYRPGSFDALPKTQAIVRAETIVITLHGVDTEKVSQVGSQIITAESQEIRQS